MAENDAAPAAKPAAAPVEMGLRVRLSVMMFLQYFVWGAWGVVIFTFISNLPTLDGLNFPGDLVGWIGGALPIGAMISPILVGLVADRFFATEKVLAVLHLAGAALLAWAAWSADQNLVKVKDAFTKAAREEKVPEDGRTLADGFKHEKELKEKVEQGGSGEKQAAEELKDFQKKLRKGIEEANSRPEVKAAVGTAFTHLFLQLLAYGLCYMPTLTLTNSISFRNLSDPDRYFGGIRVLGTIGWIAAGWVVGLCLESASTQPLYLAAGASVALGLFCFFLPHTPPSGGAKTLGDSLGLPALGMLKQPAFLIFFICSFLITIVLAFYYQQGNPFLTDIGAPLPVLLQTIGQISEIFFMLLIPVGLARLGTKGMLAVGMLAWCVRYAIFATQNVPAVIAIGLPLHGICYDFFFVVSYLYVDRQAPANLRASAQGMIGFTLLGLGMLLGNLVAGEVINAFKTGDEVAWTQVWLVPLVGSVAATIIFVLLFREPRAEKAAAQAK
jgi:nucleoside transporter